MLQLFGGLGSIDQDFEGGGRGNGSVDTGDGGGLVIAAARVGSSPRLRKSTGRGGQATVLRLFLPPSCMFAWLARRSETGCDMHLLEYSFKNWREKSSLRLI